MRNEIQRPTGIIRTLPNLYENKDNVAHRRMMLSYTMLEKGQIETVYIALDKKPTKDVLHLYVLIQGQIICRMNIAGYENGANSSVKCWDEVSRTPNWWAVCTAPISYPPAPVARRGFQGFRYTQDLW